MKPVKSIERKEIRLMPYSECVGTLFDLQIGELDVSVVLSCGSEHIVLRFSTESLESHTLRELSSCEPGTKIGLIKTDEASRPLLIRIIEPKGCEY